MFEEEPQKAVLFFGGKNSSMIGRDERPQQVVIWF